MMRAVAILAGLGLLAAATWAVIVDARLEGPHAGLVSAMAIGTAAGALVLARSRWMIGAVVLCTVLMGETYGMLATAERIIRHREAQSRADAQANPALAQARDDLASARAAIVAHDTAARQRIAEKSCAAECRGLLERTRGELVKDRETAVAALSVIPGGSTPLADRLGIAAWVLDLFSAGLLALGANGLACVLIAWGAHHKPDGGEARGLGNDTRNGVSGGHGSVALGHPVVPAVAEVGAVLNGQRIGLKVPQTGRLGAVSASEGIAPSNVVTLRRRATVKDATRFAVKALAPDADASATAREIADAYWRWCDGEGIERPDTADTVNQFAALFRKMGVTPEMTPGREIIAHGVRLTA